MSPRTLVLCALAALAAPASARAESRVVLTGHVSPHLAQSAKIDHAAAGETVPLGLAVRLDQALLDRTLAQIYSVPPAQRQYLTPAQFAQLMGLSAKRQALKDFAAQNGLTVDPARDDDNSMIVPVSGPAASVEQAFQVTLNHYQGLDGAVFRASENEPSVPSSLSPHLGAVAGLSTQAGLWHPHLRRAATAQPFFSLTGTTGVGGAMAPADIKTVYGLSGALTGAGQTVAIFELDGYNPSDIAKYSTQYSLPAATVTYKGIDGQTNLCGPNENQVCNSTTAASDGGMTEVALDIDMVMALAPGLSQILVYTPPPTNQGVLDAYNQIAVDGTAQVVSTSWGAAQSNLGASILNSEYTIFQRLAAQGQSVFAAAGDQGAYDNPNAPSSVAVDDPASQPYVTAVGGTSLTGAVGGAVTETVWNEAGATCHNYVCMLSGGAGGGGIANYLTGGTFWALPSYQVGVSGLASNTYRNVPDVSLNADPNTAPYSVCVGGTCSNFIGGTSAAAPLWAALAALVNQKRAALGYSQTLGFANPMIYNLATSSNYGASFNDITTGGNGAYTAAAGYDDATGWGSFKANALIVNINTPAPPALAASPFSNVTLASATLNWTTTGELASSTYTAQISTNNFTSVNASSVTYGVSAVFGAGGAGPALTPATTYYFRVSASSNGLTGAYSTIASTVTPPAAPTSPAVTGVWVSSLTMNWTANGNPAGTVYRVDYWQAVGSTVSVFTTSTAPAILGLAEGATYFITVGALNAPGTLAPSGVVRSTVTLPMTITPPVLLTSTGGVISIFPPTGLIVLTAPPGALTQPATVTLALPSPCASAPIASAAGSLTPTALCVQVNSGNVEPVGNTTLSFGYRLADIAGFSAQQLVIARFDPVDNVWVPLPSSVNQSAQTVTAATSHWSLFQVMQNSPSSSISSAKAFPNPWRVSQGPASMTFSMLPAGARLRIYSLSGLIVKNISADSSGLASWDGTNNAGRPAASGFYFLFVQSGGQQETLKLALQR